MLGEYMNKSLSCFLTHVHSEQFEYTCVYAGVYNNYKASNKRLHFTLHLRNEAVLWLSSSHISQVENSNG